VRRILERHGGHIRGEAQVGQGSVFEFSFGSFD
jgi:signal transduction histidine kinase